MEIFLVGGAVRDELLGEPIHERDWVVVGGTPEELIALDFQPVGRDFPVFLHPETHEEYALARTERKTGKGYKGFNFYASPKVTLEEDLKRRDLTINAIAKSPDGTLIDPYDGQIDLKAHWLRHVSPAFSEDPVRVLRIARFASRLPKFNVHPDTNKLMKEMVTSGEIDALVSERVWKEFLRALLAAHPERFFDVLNDCGALAILFPDIKSKDAGIKALKKSLSLSDDGTVRFAALCHHLGEKNVKALCKRYRIPRDYTELALLIVKQLDAYSSLNINDPAMVLRLLKSADAMRRPERFSQFLLACIAANKKHTDHSNALLQALQTVKSVDVKPLIEKNLEGLAFAKALTALQLAALSK